MSWETVWFGLNQFPVVWFLVLIRADSRFFSGILHPHLLGDCRPNLFWGSGQNCLVTVEKPVVDRARLQELRWQALGVSTYCRPIVGKYALVDRAQRSANRVT